MYKSPVLIGAACIIIIIASAVFLMIRGDKPDKPVSAHTGNQPESTNISQKNETHNFPELQKNNSEDKAAVKMKSSGLGSSNIPAENFVPNTAGEEELEQEKEYALNRLFESRAFEDLPIHTVKTFDPGSASSSGQKKNSGPKRGEIWIRIKVDHASEMKDIMAQTADLYKDMTEYDETITVMHWVGGKPYARIEFPAR